MANMIYTVAVNHDTSQFKNSDYSQYCIKSWRRWCHKNDIEFMVINKHNDNYTFPIWNKLDVCDVCKGYEKIAIVDSDTMIHWNAPNLFDTINTGLYGVQDNANLRWLHNSVKNYGGEFFSDFKIDLDKYINAGVVFLDNKSLSIYDKLREFYFDNQEKLDSWNKGGGREQTLFNFLLQINNYDVKLLPPIWNMISMHKRDLLCQTLDGIPIEPFGFAYNWQDGDDKTPFFIKYSWIWHFTGFPIEERTKIMKQTWELVGDKYKWNQ